MRRRASCRRPSLRHYVMLMLLLAGAGAAGFFAGSLFISAVAFTSAFASSGLAISPALAPAPCGMPFDSRAADAETTPTGLAGAAAGAAVCVAAAVVLA